MTNLWLAPSCWLKVSPNNWNVTLAPKLPPLKLTSTRGIAAPEQPAGVVAVGVAAVGAVGDEPPPLEPLQAVTKATTRITLRLTAGSPQTSRDGPRSWSRCRSS